MRLTTKPAVETRAHTRSIQLSTGEDVRKPPPPSARDLAPTSAPQGGILPCLLSCVLTFRWCSMRHATTTHDLRLTAPISKGYVCMGDTRQATPQATPAKCYEKMNNYGKNSLWRGLASGRQKCIQNIGIWQFVGTRPLLSEFGKLIMSEFGIGIPRRPGVEQVDKR